MQGLLAEWYRVLSSVSGAATVVLQGVLASTGGSLASALVLGLIGSLSPCQLTTNSGALAYLAARPRIARSTLAYVLGKITVYTILAGGALLLGQAMNAAAIPMAVVARRILGPAMLLAGLVMLRVLRPRWLVGSRLADTLRRRAESGGSGRAYLLGAGFSVAFCPTMALLFFGLLIPMAARAQLGLAYPAAFGLGTAVPLGVITAAVATGLASARASSETVGRIDRWVQVAAGALFLLAGLNDTLVYWLT